MKKGKTFLLLFSTFLIATTVTTVTSVARLVNYTGNGLSNISSFLEVKLKEENKKENIAKQEENKKEREKANNVLYYDGYVDSVQRQLVADYINFFNRAIKKHPRELRNENIKFIGKRPLIGDVFYHSVGDQIYRSNNNYNDFDALLITDNGDNYVFQSQKCKLNHKTTSVDIIKTEGPGNNIGYFMLPKNSPDDFSYIPDCTIFKLLKAE